MGDVSAAAPALGFREDFPGVSTSSWSGGAPFSNPGTGGVGGADGYLEVVSRWHATDVQPGQPEWTFLPDFNRAMNRLAYAMTRGVDRAEVLQGGDLADRVRDQIKHKFPSAAPVLGRAEDAAALHAADALVELLLIGEQPLLAAFELRQAALQFIGRHRHRPVSSLP